MDCRKSRTSLLTQRFAAMVVRECGQAVVALWLGCLIDRMVLRVGMRGEVVVSMPLGFRLPFNEPEFARMTSQQEDAFCRAAIAAGGHAAEVMWGLASETVPGPRGGSGDPPGIQTLGALLDEGAIGRAEAAARRALETEWDGMKRLVHYVSTRLRRAVRADPHVRKVIVTERGLVAAFRQ